MPGFREETKLQAGDLVSTNSTASCLESFVTVGKGIKQMFRFKFDDLPVRTKVLAAFGVILLMTTALGLFAINRLEAVNTAAVDIRDNWLPSTVVVGQIAKLTERYRLFEARMLFARDETERREAIATMVQIDRQISEARRAYEPLVTPGEERRLTEAADQAWANYRTASNRLRDLSEAGDLQAATAQYLTGPAYDSFITLREMLNQDAALNEREGKKAANLGESLYHSTLWGIVLGLVGAALGCLVVGLAMVAGIVGPVRSLTEAMRRLAQHDLTVIVSATDRKDEIGAMAAAVEVFKQNMIETDRLAAERHQDIEARTRRVERRDQLTATFEASIERVVATVSRAAGDMRGSAQTLDGTAHRTSERANAAAVASEQASSNVQTVASATEQLAASTNAISEQVSRAAQTASQASAEARHTDTTVKGLSEAAQKIGDVVNFINDIASQTNLLALNATIEAARAGEAGKGFAVVANEVKSLATQTAKATEDIRREVEEMQAASHQAARAIEGIVTTISDINEISTAIAAAVEEQGAATREIARNVQQAALGARDVSTNIDSVNQAAAETGSAAREVLGAADSLSGEAETLRREVETYLVGIRTS